MQSVETSLLVILINNPKLIENLQIKPKYLFNPDNAILLNAFIEMYQKYKTISYDLIKDNVKENDLGRIVNLYAEIISNELYTPNDVQKKFDVCQRKILEDFKERYRKELNQQYLRGEIQYLDVKTRLNKIDEYQITSNAKVITKEELENNIKISNVGIKFNKFLGLSEKLKLLQNDLLIVGATTGAGKSGFLLNLMNDLMGTYQCIYFNIEMSKATIYRRLIAINKDIPVNCIDNPSEYQQKLINYAIDEITNDQIIIEHQMSNVKEIRNVIATMKNTTKHTIVFIDHIGLLRGDDNKKSLYEQSTEVMKQLRSICLDYDCTMICASQLNRTAYNAESIGLQMLKDSGEVENSARKAILLYQNKEETTEEIEPVMNIDIAKNDTGMTGIIKMKYFKTKQIFKEV